MIVVEGRKGRNIEEYSMMNQIDHLEKIMK